MQSHALVDQRLYRLLVNVSGLEGHLSSLKGLFLMGRGSLFHSFFDKAREAMKVKAGDRYEDKQATPDSSPVVVQCLWAALYVTSFWGSATSCPNLRRQPPDAR